MLALALLAGACGGDDAATETGTTPDATQTSPEETADDESPEGTETATAAAEDLGSLTYLTSFSTFGRDAYVYVAKEKGYFEEAGLEVTINPGSGTVDVMRLLAAGTADIGAGDSAGMIITSAEQDLAVRAIAATHQQSLSAIAVLETSGIEEPADLEGKTWADSPSSTVKILFDVFASAAGFDPGEVEFVSSTPPNLPQLLASARVDAIGQFIVGKPLLESVADDPVRFFQYADYLEDLYGIWILANEDVLQDRPDAVRAFREALMRGLEYSIENPQEAGEILAQYADAQSAEVAAAELEIMAEFVRPEEQGVPIGAISEDRVQGMIDLLTEAGAIEGDITVDDVVASDFLPQSEGS